MGNSATSGARIKEYHLGTELHRPNRLYHFSENPGITTFVPRPVEVPAQRPRGMDWLNGPLVWAIADSVQFMYLFPRDLPRTLLWATNETTPQDRADWLGDHRAAAYVEQHRLPELQAAAIYRYELPTESFEDLHDAGVWVSRETVTPRSCERLSDLPAHLARLQVDLRPVASLVPLAPLWQTSLHTSGIRLRHAVGWPPAPATVDHA